MLNSIKFIIISFQSIKNNCIGNVPYTITIDQRKTLEFKEKSFVYNMRVLSYLVDDFLSNNMINNLFRYFWILVSRYV
jgi:acid phosphatase class B